MSDEYRRADDDAEPLSPAHQVISDRVGALDEKLQAHIDQEPALVTRAVAKGIAEHEARIAHLAEDLVALTPGLADVVYGPPQRHPVTKEILVDGHGIVLRDSGKGLRSQLLNGGLRVEPSRVHFKLTGPQLVLVGTIVTALATIAVALIQQWGQ